jgi:hypothetical protein
MLELLHTTMGRGPVSPAAVQDLLVIGVPATVRHGLGIAATRGEPRDITLNLTVNALAAHLLVISLRLVRNQHQEEGREADGRRLARHDRAWP